MKTVIQIMIALIIAAPAIAEVSPRQIRVPKEIRQEIRFTAAQNWPDDYSMQAYEIEKQTESYQMLYAWAHNNKENELAEKIFRNVQRDWPGNYEMQWYVAKSEVEALKKIYGD